MEALLSSGGPQSDVLIGPLKFGLDPQGSYVTQRRQSTTFSNVNSASPAGVKTITINCGSSSEWLDPSTVLLSFLITNTDGTNALFPATVGAHCLFDRLQLRLGSTLIEDVSDFGKLTEIMQKMSMSPQKKWTKDSSDSALQLQHPITPIFWQISTMHRQSQHRAVNVFT